MTWLKRTMPRSLFGRWMVLLLAPVVLLQFVSAVVFYQGHWDTVSRRLALGVAGEIALLLDSRALIPDPVMQERVRFMAAQHLQLDVRFVPGGRLPGDTPAPRFWSILDRMLNQALSEKVRAPYEVDTRGGDGTIRIWIELPDGVLAVEVIDKRLFSTTSYVFIIWMVGSSIVLLAIAVLFLRNQIRPIRALASAADAFGKGREVDFRPSGATEVRQAAAAFQLMQRRIQRQIAQRTEMLAGVSHDLRTPLTRLKLQLAMLDAGTAGVSDMERDIAEMQTMIEGYLAFARGEDGEVAVPLDLPEFLDDIAADMRRQGGDVEVSPAPKIELPLRPTAFRRCIVNLVENGLRHAKRVRIGVSRQSGIVEIAVDDDGPGIPAEQREEAFRPFVRLDPARSTRTGGVGLGLTIARDVARAHGGDLQLLAAPLGGLRAVVRLPL